ncbi:MAG: ArsA family ATPase [Sandaracinaceae bacterium]
MSSDPAQSAESPLKKVLETHRVVVCVGSGGVGKTTTAASLALWAAIHGRRVLCLTIDPARRLATSLGLPEMTTEEKAIDPSLLGARGIAMKGSLSAMMLDGKRTFDDLVRRTASSPARAERILDNRLYQYISGSLAGTQEYMAMEKLHAVRADERYDLIVLDTPPTSNALDFLDAPERLAGLVDSPTMKWIVTAFESKGGFSLVGRGARMVLQGISKLTGAGFLEQVATFLMEFNDLFGGFRRRSEEVGAALRSPEVAFVIVTSPAPLAIEEAIFFAERLGEAGMNRDALVVNQVHRVLPEVKATSAVLEAEAKPHLGGLDSAKIVGRVRRAYDDAKMRAQADRIQIDALRKRVDPTLPLLEVPVFDHDVHDLDALAAVGRTLVG